MDSSKWEIKDNIEYFQITSNNMDEYVKMYHQLNDVNGLKSTLKESEFNLGGKKIRFLDIGKVNSTRSCNATITLRVYWNSYVIDPKKEYNNVIWKSKGKYENIINFEYKDEKLKYVNYIEGDNSKEFIKILTPVKHDDLLKIIIKVNNLLNFATAKQTCVLCSIDGSKIIYKDRAEELILDECITFFNTVKLLEENITSINYDFFTQSDNLINEFLNVYAEFEVHIKENYLDTTNIEGQSYKNKKNKYEKDIKKNAKEYAKNNKCGIYTEEEIKKFEIFRNNKLNNLPKLIKEDKYIIEFQKIMNNKTDNNLKGDLYTLFINDLAEGNRLRNKLFHNGPVRMEPFEMGKLTNISHAIRLYLAFEYLKKSQIELQKIEEYLDNIYFSLKCKTTNF